MLKALGLDLCPTNPTQVLQMNDLMKIHMPKPRSNEMLNPKCPKKQFCFIVKMNSWYIEGLSVNLTKNTFGPCAYFLLRQMYEEKRIRWDN